MYWLDATTTMLWHYALKYFTEQLNVLKVDDDGITPIEKFPDTIVGITLENRHTWIFTFTVYVLDAWFQGDIAGLTKWEPRSRSGIYICHSPFNAGSVALVINPATVHFSPQLHVVFDDEFPHLHSWGKAQYPQIGKILCSASHKVVHQIIMNSRILGSLQILRKIQTKIQLTCQEFHQKTTEI